MNTQSIVNKIDELEIVLLKYDPHVVVITETWLNHDIADEDIIRSYKMFRTDRLSRGGGVAVIVIESVGVTLFDQICEHESLFLRLHRWGHCFILGVVYRPPNSTPEFLLKLYDQVLKFKNDKIMLVGDFSVPEVSWDPL